jgi:hypothetical protein
VVVEEVVVVRAVVLILEEVSQSQVEVAVLKPFEYAAEDEVFLTQKKSVNTNVKPHREWIVGATHKRGIRYDINKEKRVDNKWMRNTSFC